MTDDTRARDRTNCPFCDLRDADAKEWALAWVDKQKECNGLRELCEEMHRMVSFMSPAIRHDLLPDWFVPRLESLLSNPTLNDWNRLDAVTGIPKPAGEPKWCEECKSWRHTMPCGRDGCE